MTDVHSKEVRSYNMSRIKGKDTKPEIIVRKYLFSKGFRFRLNVKKLPGRPDIVLPKYKTVIFVNGCFWHGHEGCRYFVIPKTRTAWWLNKINTNKERDRNYLTQLKEQGWNVVSVWECELKPDKKEKTLQNLMDLLLHEVHTAGSYEMNTVPNMVAEDRGAYHRKKDSSDVK